MTLKESPVSFGGDTGQRKTGGKPDLIHKRLISESNSQEKSQKNGRIFEFDTRRIVEELKSSLPEISSCTDLKKESHDSECGPCPKCGGTDRFVSKNGKCWCRQCHPEAMDVIDFHAWIVGKSTTDFL
jgi:hypothetical protein